MKAMLACTSHSPLMLIRPRAPVVEPELLEQRRVLAERIDAFAPDRVVFVGNDHFAGFHYATMPPFCIGLDAQSVGDLGGFQGSLRVPRDDAMTLLQSLRDDGFDPAVSYRMKVDHAFSQPLQLLAGGLDRHPVIPVFTSVFTPPFVRFSRSRAFGAALGSALRALGGRTLLMASGGLSHHPTRYFPTMDEAPADVLGYQMAGDRGGTMGDVAWFERFARLHVEGAQMVADGRRTATDMRMNPELDRWVLQRLATGDTAAFDGWDPQWVVQNAGIGMLEIHSWLVAVSAYGQLLAGDGAALDTATWYAPIPEYGVGFGLLSATAA